MSDFARPTIFLSQCLTRARCRWDGEIVDCEAVARLLPFVDVVAHCPETAIGLGVPRPAIRVIERRGERRLWQPEIGRDLTAAMRAHAAEALERLPPVDGFLFKARSPSCGLIDGRVFADEQAAEPFALGAGVFAAEALRRCGDLPMADETRLADPAAREHYLSAVFTLADFRRVRAVATPQALLEFHARHGELLSLGRVLDRLGVEPLAAILNEYGAALRVALAQGARSFHPPGI